MPPRKSATKAVVQDEPSVAEFGIVVVPPPEPKTDTVALDWMNGYRGVGQTAAMVVLSERDELYGIKHEHITYLSQQCQGLSEHINPTSQGIKQMSISAFLNQQKVVRGEAEKERVIEVFRATVNSFRKTSVYGFEVDAGFICLCMSKCALAYGGFSGGFTSTSGRKWLSDATELVVKTLLAQLQRKSVETLSATPEFEEAIRKFLTKMWIFVLAQSNGKPPLKKSTGGKSQEELRASKEEKKTSSSSARAIGAKGKRSRHKA